MKKQAEARKKKPRRRRLSIKILVGYGIGALLLVILICTVVSRWYWEKGMDDYITQANFYTKTAADYIDGDRVLTYLETGETDEYYQQVQDFLSATQRNTNLLYYYVFVPHEDGMIYIWDTGDPENVCPLGYQEDGYMEREKEAIHAALQPDPPEQIIFLHDDVYGDLACAFTPLLNSHGDVVALVGADMSTEDMVQTLLVFISIIIDSVLNVVLISMVIFYFFIRRNIIKPISLLSAGAKGMANNLETSNTLTLEIHTNDEIEELAESFTQMDLEVRDYIQRLSVMTAEKERIGAELSVATQIQADMLPRIFPAFPMREEFDIYATMTPAKEVGGDFYDFFMVDEDHLMMVIADVSGKGVPAALFMVIAKTLLKNSAEQGLSPKEIFQKVNNQLCENNDEGMFVTVWMGMLEISTGKLTCSNAGHDDPILIRNGTAEIVRQRHGLLMAQMEDIPYREQEMILQPGDTIFVYTDGVSEATSAQTELYGKERLLEALNRGAGKTPKELLAAIKEDVDAFVGEAPQFDDITMLALNIRPQAAPALAELNTEPTLDNLYPVISFVEDTLSELGVPMKIQMRINVAVDEIFANIVHYSGAGTCTVACGMQGSRAIVRFTDDGIPYDPTSRPEMDTTLSLEERGVGGMGIHMVRKTMDEVRYEFRDGHNILTIEKAW